MDDMEKAAVGLRDLDARWKQAREAPRDKSEALWNRFKVARDAAKMRGEGPVVFAQVTKGVGVDTVIEHVLATRTKALAR